MAKLAKALVDKNLRELIFDDLMEWTSGNPAYEYQKINDRQYGTIITDLNGEQRYVRIGVIVAEQREGVTPQELMQNEIDAYRNKQADKEAKAKAKAEKVARDKAKREAQATADTNEDDSHQYLEREIAV